jgi:hypothetical protein
MPAATLAPLPIFSAQAGRTAPCGGGLRPFLSLDRRMPTCQLSLGLDVPSHPLESAMRQRHRAFAAGREELASIPRRGGSAASPRQGVAAIGVWPHHRSDGCTLSKQTPRPAAVASPMGQQPLSRPLSEAREMV